MKNLLYILIGMLLFTVTSCTTTKVVEVPVEVVKTEYVYRDRVDTVIKNDFIKIHDSIYVQISGDTVYKYVERIKYLNSNNNHMSYKTDTFIKVDSIPIPIVTEIEKVSHKLYWWQSTLAWLGGLSLLGFGIWLFFKLIK